MSDTGVVSLPGNLGRISARVPEVGAIHIGKDWTSSACILHAGPEPPPDEPGVSGCHIDGDRPPAARRSGRGAPAGNRTRCSLLVKERQASSPRALLRNGRPECDDDWYSVTSQGAAVIRAKGPSGPFCARTPGSSVSPVSPGPRSRTPATLHEPVLCPLPR